MLEGKIFIYFDIFCIKKSLQKSTHFCRFTFFLYVGIFVKFRLIPKGRERHPASFCRNRSRDFSGAPSPVYFMKVHRQRFRRSAELHSSCFRRRNTLSLPLADVGAFILCHKRQDLENNITHECSHQVFATAGVQQRHSVVLTNPA